MSADLAKLSANARLSLARFGFRTRQVETVVSVGTTAVVLVRNNPDRVALLLVLEGANRVTVGRNGQVTTTSGLPMPAQYDSLEFTWDTDGEATGYERWAIANVAASDVRVVETIRVVR